MSLLTMRWSLGWWASARTPPTRMPPAELRAISDRVTVMPRAPRPTPLACAPASLPMPMAVWPRLTNRESLKVMVLAAEICTAAGICCQCGRAASNCVQPLWQESKLGQLQLPEMYAPVCWST